MITAAELMVRVEADTHAAEAALGRVNEKIGGLGRITGPVTGAIGGLARGLATFGLAARGAETLAHAFSGLTEAAIGEQNVQSQLDAVLKSTGGAAGMTRDQLIGMSRALQDTTRFSDDTVLSAENMLLTFTGIGKDVFPQATNAVLDMSTALGEDTKSAAIQLGKALNDPINGVTALQRVGVRLTDQQKEQVKAMVAAGDTMGAQTLILHELATEFGGSATAAGKTFAGQMDILHNRIEDAQKAIGLALMPTILAFANVAIPLGVAAIETFAGLLTTRIIPAVNKLADFLRGPLNYAFVLVRDAVLTMQQAIQGDWTNDAKIRPLHKIMGELGLLIRNDVIPAWNFLSGAVDTARTHFDDIMAVLRPILTIMQGPFGNALKGAIEGFGDKGLAGILPGAIDGLKHFGEAFLTLGGIIKDALGKVDWAALGSTIIDGIGGALSGLANIAAGVDWTGIATGMLTALSDAFPKVSGIAWDAGKTVAGWLSGKWDGIAGAILHGVRDGFDKVTGIAWDAAATVVKWVGNVQWGNLATTLLTSLRDALLHVAGITWDAATTIVGWVTNVQWGTLATTLLTSLRDALVNAAAITWDAAMTVAKWVTTVQWGTLATTILTGIWNGIVNAAALVWDAATTIGKWITTVQWGTLATTILTGIWNGLINAAALVWDVGATLVKWLSTQDWSGIASFVLTHIRDALAIVVGITWDAAQWITNLIQTTNWSDVASFITGKIGDGIKLITTLGDAVASAITSHDYTPAGQQIGTQIATGVQTGLNQGGGGDQSSGGGNGQTWLRRLIGDVGPLNAVIDEILQSITKLQENVKRAFDQIGDSFGPDSAFGQQIRHLEQAVKPTFEAIGESLFTLLVVATLVVSKIAEVFSSVLAPGIRIAGEVIAGVLGGIASAFDVLNTVVGTMVTVGGDIVGGIVDGVSGAWHLLTDEVGKAKDEVTGAITAAASWLKDTGIAIIQGVVDGITGAWSTLTGKVGEIQGGVTGAITGATDWLHGVGMNVIYGLVNGITDAWSAMTGKAGQIEGAVQGAVSGAITWLYQKGWDAIQGLVDGINAAIANLDPVGIVAGIGGKIAGALNPFSRSPWPRMIKYGFDAIHGLAIGITTGDATFDPAGQIAAIGTEMLALLTTAIKSGQTDAAKAAADTVKSVVDAFSALLDLGTQLKTATFPGIEQISQLKFLTEHAVKSIADSAALFSGDGLKAAKDFADTGKAIFDLFGSVLSAFADPKKINLPTFEQVSAIKFLVEHAVRSIADSAAMFTGDALTNAKAFADAASTIVGMLKSAVDAFASLASFDATRDVDVAMLVIQLFVGNLMIEMSQWARVVNADVRDAAVSFASGIKDVVGWIKDAITAFDALAGFDSSKDIDVATLVLELFVGNLIIELNIWSTAVNTDVRAAAVQFAAAVSATIGWIKDAIGAFQALAAFDPTPDVDYATLVLELFVGNLLIELNIWAGVISTDVRAAAVALADSIKSVVGWITDSIKAFDALAAFDPTPDIDYATVVLELFVGNLIIELGIWAGVINTDVQAAAVALAASIKNTVGWIIDAIGAFDALAKFDPTPDIDYATLVLELFVGNLIIELGIWAGVINKDVQTAAIALSVAIKDSVGWIIDAINAFNALSNFDPTPDIDEAMLVLELFVGNVIIELGIWAKAVNENVRTAADGFATSVKNAIGWITDAVSAFNALATFNYKPVVDKSVTVLLAFATYVIQQLSTARGSWTDAALKAAIGYADAVKSVVGWISDAVKAFEALQTLKPSTVSDRLKVVIDMTTLAIGMLATASDNTSKQITRAAEFATKSQIVVSTIGSGVDAFKKLSEARFTSAVLSQLTAFGGIVTQAVAMLVQYDNDLDPGVTAADSIAAKINKIIATLASAGAALGAGSLPSGVPSGAAGSANGGLGSAGNAPQAAAATNSGPVSARIDSGDMQSMASQVASAVGSAITSAMNGLAPATGSI